MYNTRDLYYTIYNPHPGKYTPQTPGIFGCSMVRMNDYADEWCRKNPNGPNLVDTNPFLMSFAPFESHDRGLSNAVKLVQNGSVLTKL